MSDLVPTAVTERALVRVEFSQEQVELIKKQLMPGASNDDLALFLATCKRLNLDPFARQVFSVKRWSAEDGERWTTMVSIDGFRLVASRSGAYEGQEGPFWCGQDGVWKDVWLLDEPPMAAKVGVWRTGFRAPIWGVAAYASYVQTKKGGDPNRMWSTMPDVMLAKVAEALALRKAFPNDLSGVYAAEEMDQADNVPQDAHPLANATRGTNAETSQERAKAAAAPAPDPAMELEFKALSVRLKAVPGYGGDDADGKKKRIEWISGALGYKTPPAKLFHAYAKADPASKAHVAELLAALERIVGDDVPDFSDVMPVDGPPAPGWDDANKMPRPDADAGQKPRGAVTRADGRVSQGAAKTGVAERDPGEDDEMESEPGHMEGRK